MKKDFEKNIKRTEAENIAINKRLKILLGQIAGIEKMVDNNASCDELLIQISAVYSACKSLANFIIEKHIETSVIENLKAGNMGVLHELSNIYKRFQ